MRYKNYNSINVYFPEFGVFLYLISSESHVEFNLHFFLGEFWASSGTQFTQVAQEPGGEAWEE